MKHLVTIAFDFDDKTVTDKIHATVEKTVIEKKSQKTLRKNCSRQILDGTASEIVCEDDFCSYGEKRKDGVDPWIAFGGMTEE